MEYIYKTSFTSKAAFETFKETLMIGEAEERRFPFRISHEGHISFEAVKDEKGNEITPAGQHEDWAVDIVAKEKTDIFDEFLIDAQDNYRFGQAGGSYEIITK